MIANRRSYFVRQSGQNGWEVALAYTLGAEPVTVLGVSSSSRGGRVAARLFEFFTAGCEGEDVDRLGVADLRTGEVRMHGRELHKTRSPDNDDGPPSFSVCRIHTTVAGLRSGESLLTAWSANEADRLIVALQNAYEEGKAELSRYQRE
jgi:hypothetical protein